MEDYEDEVRAMAGFLRHRNPRIFEQQAKLIASIAYPRGTDIAAATAATYTSYAEAWMVPLRSDPEYRAWRREREPGYMPLDDSAPIAMACSWENVTLDAWAALPEAYRKERARLAREQIVLAQRDSRRTPEATLGYS